jgi:hypothetical protein
MLTIPKKKHHHIHCYVNLSMNVEYPHYIIIIISIVMLTYPLVICYIAIEHGHL